MTLGGYSIRPLRAQPSTRPALDGVRQRRRPPATDWPLVSGALACRFSTTWAIWMMR
jgi:hypothetical protein